MRACMAKAFPGFSRINGFFAGLKGDFEPVVSTGEAKTALKDLVQCIDGPAAEDFRKFRNDFAQTAEVREVRRYADGRTYVRFEFKRLLERRSSCCTTEEPAELCWDGPHNLAAVFDSSRRLESYTLIPEGDPVRDGIEFRVSSRGTGHLGYCKTEDVQRVLDHLTSGRGWREAIIYDKHTQRVVSNILGYGDGRGFQMYWVLCCQPWQLGINDATFDQVRACIEALRTGGIRAFEDAADWDGPACD